MNRREFLASVAALGGVAFGPTGSDPDPEIPVVLLWKWRMAATDGEAACEEWYGIRIAYRYAWAWADDDGVHYGTHSTKALTPTDNPHLFRARLSEMRAMLAENKRAEKVRWSKFRELPPARRGA